MPLINCEIGLDLSLSKYSVRSKISRTSEVSAANPADATLTTDATFRKNNAKLYVPVVILSINDNIKFVENIKQGFRKQFLGTNIKLFRNSGTTKKQ